MNIWKKENDQKLILKIPVFQFPYFSSYKNRVDRLRSALVHSSEGHHCHLYHSNCPYSGHTLLERRSFQDINRLDHTFYIEERIIPDIADPKIELYVKALAKKAFTDVWKDNTVLDRLTVPIGGPRNPDANL